jgi:chloride channel, nucleotide-sensitive, 1A
VNRNLTLYSSTKNIGFSVDYPAIALHALGTHHSSLFSDASSQVVLLQINLHDTELTNSDDDIQTLDLTLVPTSTSGPSPTNSGNDGEALNPVKALFDALSTCADLHPDPASPGSEDDEPQPGAGGWITSENMADFVDDEGNFIGMDSLGAGAGTVRSREDDTGANGTNGTDDPGDGKWQRTG